MTVRGFRDRKLSDWLLTAQTLSVGISAGFIAVQTSAAFAYETLADVRPLNLSQEAQTPCATQAAYIRRSGRHLGQGMAGRVPRRPACGRSMSGRLCTGSLAGLPGLFGEVPDDGAE